MPSHVSTVISSVSFVGVTTERVKISRAELTGLCFQQLQVMQNTLEASHLIVKENFFPDGAFMVCNSVAVFHQAFQSILAGPRHT